MPDSAIAMSLLVGQSPDAVIFAGTDGVIQVWNAAAERVFGFPAAEAIGQDLNIIIPERFRDAHWTGYDRALAAGVTKYAGRSLPTRAQMKDGTQIYVELGFSIIVDNGAVLGALATARDITERFERERADRQKMRDLQAQLEGAAPAPAST
jgi:PAS domain S-box-containing protein